MTRFLAGALLTAAAGFAAADDYASAVLPILEQKCVGCHSGDEPKAGLRLDTLDNALAGGQSGPALTLGNAGTSLLVARISLPPEQDGVMPPGEHEKLSADQVLAIMHWVGRQAPVAVAAAEPEAGPDGTPWVDFPSQIEPILSATCYSCHGAERQRGELRLDSAEAILAGGELGVALVAGDPDASPLLTRTLLAIDHADFMPQSGDPLTAEQQDLLRRWIAQGGSFEARAVPAAATQVAAAEEEPWPPFTPRAASTVIAELSESVTPYDEAALTAVQATGALALPLARQSPLVRVDFQRLSEPLTGEHLTLLAPLAEQVTWLSLAGTAVTDADLAHLSGLVNLTRLDLSNTGITDAGLAHLSGLPRLEYLNLYNSKVTDAGIDHIAGIATLRDVFTWLTGITETGVAKLQGAVPGVVVVTGADLPAPDAAK